MRKQPPSEAPNIEVVLAADAGPGAGLGHLGRASALGAGLRTRGAEISCLGLGLSRSLELDGLMWRPASASAAFAARADAVVLDAYSVAGEELERAGSRAPVAVFDDFGDPPLAAALVVDVAAEDEPGDRILGGFRYAAVRSPFWGLPERRLSARVSRVLVSTGGGATSEAGLELGLAVARMLPETTVTVVGCAGTRFRPSPGVQVVDAQPSLLRLLLEADLAICAGGQTMLEVVAAGTPCLAVGLAENQQRQATRLAALGAVAWVDRPDAAIVATTAARLADDPVERLRLSRAGQKAVDGLGALRLAFHVVRLAEGGR